MIVVSDTSPLISLAAIGRLDVLRKLYTQIMIPTVVHQEAIGNELNRRGTVDILKQEWIILSSVKNTILIQALENELDRGEAAAIALAVELHANLVLIDERLARLVATRLGLNVIGVLGLLLEAKKKGVISLIKPVLDSLLTNAGFWFSPDLYQQVLLEAGEKY